MNLTSHPVPFARLADLVEGRLPAEERAATQAHLAACRRCSEQAAELEKTIGLMRTDESIDAPRDVLSYTISMFRMRRAAAEASPSLLGRIIARLTFDSARNAPAFGVRSAQTADSHQLMFNAGAHDIDLRLTRGDEGWTISGQVLGECAGGRVEVEGAEGFSARAELNELCEFSLPHVPAGSYRLLLHLADADVQIPEINLTA